jgi:hypothetical protein
MLIRDPSASAASVALRPNKAVETDAQGHLRLAAFWFLGRRSLLR